MVDPAEPAALDEDLGRIGLLLVERRELYVQHAAAL